MIYERVAISVWEEAVLSPLRGELLIDNLDNCIVITKASRAYAHTLALATNKTSKFSPISGLSQSVMVLRPPTDPVTHKGWSLLHRFHAMQVILTHARWPRRGRSPPTRTVTRLIAEKGNLRSLNNHIRSKPSVLCRSDSTHLCRVRSDRHIAHGVDSREKPTPRRPLLAPEDSRVRAAA